MAFPRSSGILCHPTSFPGGFGIGDLGPSSDVFLDWLSGAGQTVWQVLPLGPTGYGDSPYQNHSSFAGNPLLISPERLVESGLLPKSAIEEIPRFPADRVDFNMVGEFKRSLLQRSFAGFRTG